MRKILGTESEVIWLDDVHVEFFKEFRLNQYEKYTSSDDFNLAVKALAHATTSDIFNNNHWPKFPALDATGFYFDDVKEDGMCLAKQDEILDRPSYFFGKTLDEETVPVIYPGINTISHLMVENNRGLSRDIHQWSQERGLNEVERKNVIAGFRLTLESFLRTRLICQRNELKTLVSTPQNLSSNLLNVTVTYPQASYRISYTRYYADNWITLPGGLSKIVKSYLPIGDYRFKVQNHQVEKEDTGRHVISTQNMTVALQTF
jgi:hypothetical protein